MYVRCFRHLWAISLLFAGSVQAQQSLTWIMADGASEPYQIVSPNPELMPHSGIFTDTLKAILTDTGAHLRTQVRPYKRIRLDLLAERHDFWVSYGSPAWLDERVLALGEYSQIPVLETRYLLAALNSSTPLELGKVRGKRLIVIHGYTYFPAFQHWVEANRIQLIYAPSHRHALAMLRQYRGDLYLAEELRIYWQARQLGMEMAELQLLDFSVIIPNSVVYFLFDRRIPADFREQLNQSLQNLQISGALNAIIERYR